LNLQTIQIKFSHFLKKKKEISKNWVQKRISFSSNSYSSSNTLNSFIWNTNSDLIFKQFIQFTRFKQKKKEISKNWVQKRISFSSNSYIPSNIFNSLLWNVNSDLIFKQFIQFTRFKQKKKEISKNWFNKTNFFSSNSHSSSNTSNSFIWNTNSDLIFKQFIQFTRFKQKKKEISKNWSQKRISFSSNFHSSSNTSNPFIWTTTAKRIFNQILQIHSF
jgi:phenylalanyl-tRNA synthetase alpha subunit